MQKTLIKYTTQFSSLHTNKQQGVPAPHKAVLLLSVIDLIETRDIKSNEIEISEKIERYFKSNWKKFIGRSVVFTPKIGTPFFHLNYEPFWSLIPFSGGEDTIAMMRKGNPYSIGTIRKNFRCARIDSELFVLLQDEDARAKLRTTLISIYIQPQKRVIDSLLPILIASILVA